ncbi:MAG TPA: hypothetical protein VGL94_06105 [Ktedonobacteraceae bacterium]|jgi:methyl-accepting chemotaxis protein
MYTAVGNSYPVTGHASPTPSYNPFSKLEAIDANLAERVRNLIKTLEKRAVQDGARRLTVVAQQFQDFTVEGAYQYLKKDEIILELEEKGALWLSVLHGLRDLLSIAPIAFTWLALSLASDAYQKDLMDKSVSAKDLYQPFLLLWQEGFHGTHGFVIPFSNAALCDAVLLAFLILMFVLIVPKAKRKYRENIYKSLHKNDFDSVIDDLLALIGREGANTLLQDRDTKKIAEIIKQVLGDVLLNYDRVASEARDYIQEAKKQTETLVIEFRRDLALFNKDVQLLTNNLQKMNTNLQSHDQQLQTLTNASNRLASSSNDLASNAKDLASSADLNAQASQGIGDRLNDLNTTQQEIVKTQQQVAQEVTTAQQKVVQKIADNQENVYQEIVKAQQQVVQQVTTAQQNVVQKIADTQKEVVNELTGAADVVERSGKHTRDASLNLEQVASKLDQLTRTDFQIMTDGIKNSNQDLIIEVQKTIRQIVKAADEVERVATKLSQFDKPAKALNDAADQVSTAAAGLPQLQQPLQELTLAARMISASASQLPNINVLLQQPSQKLNEAAENLEKAASSLITTANKRGRSQAPSGDVPLQSSQQNPPPKSSQTSQQNPSLRASQAGHHNPPPRPWWKLW